METGENTASSKAVRNRSDAGGPQCLISCLVQKFAEEWIFYPSCCRVAQETLLFLPRSEKSQVSFSLSSCRPEWQRNISGHELT